MDWQPGTDSEILRARAQLHRRIREFFFDRGVLEVVTPALGAHGVTDVHIASVPVVIASKRYFLQTSPEYAMKRLLAAGSGPIYQMGPAFRGGESGERHNAEFVMLEWYRPGFTLEALVEEVEALVSALFHDFEISSGLPWSFSYAARFFDRFGLDPHSADDATLWQLATSSGGEHLTNHGDAETRNDCLDFLFSSSIEQELIEPTFVVDYPATQAALAEIAPNESGQAVARRFELFWKGTELANGYQELRNAQELRERFENNNRMREARGLDAMTIDEKLLAALPQLPQCCGVALGVDRLLMLLTGRGRLDDVVAFSDKRL